MTNSAKKKRLESPEDFDILKESLLELFSDEEQVPEEDYGVDVEADDDFLTGLTSFQEPAVEETPENTNIQNTQQMNVVSLDDLMSLLQQIVPGASTAQAAAPQAQPTATQTVPPTPEATKSSAPLEGGDEALKRVFFQGDGNETLDSEFGQIDFNLDNLTQHLSNDQSYVSLIDAKPNQGGGIPQPQANALRSDLLNDDEVPAGANRLVMGLPTSEGFDAECEDEDGYEELTKGLNGDFNSSKEELLDEENPEEELNEDDDFEEFGGHPDIQRIVGGRDFSTEEDDDILLDDNDLTPPPIAPAGPAPVTMNKNIPLAGQTVQIMLTGVTITMPELQYIGECARKYKTKLRQIIGKGNQLRIVVEANGKRFTIDYSDSKKSDNPTPFRIKKYAFTSLNEALTKINGKNELREADLFNKVMGEGYYDRAINDFTETDMFANINENINYVQTWNVMPVGAVNLKTGMNSVYSRITEGNQEPNTLVKSKTGDYFLLKGNLKERSALGTRKELVDLNEKKSYGVVEVVELYENTTEGLGKLMYDLKRTSIPMLVWR